jgi:DNA repair protein RecO (recombination protein O)
MLHKTRGIVLKTIKYADNNLIAKIYTEQFGLRTYFVKGLSGKSGKARKALLQSLSLINLHVYEKQSADIQQIRDIECAYFFQNIHSDIRKSTILVFLNEVLYKTIIEEAANPELFGFVFQSIIQLDNAEENIAIFHAIFLIQLTRYLGFYPQNSYSEKYRYFDLTEGSYVKEQPLHSDYFDGELSRVFSAIL